MNKPMDNLRTKQVIHNMRFFLCMSLWKPAAPNCEAKKPMLSHKYPCYTIKGKDMVFFVFSLFSGSGFLARHGTVFVNAYQQGRQKGTGFRSSAIPRPVGG